MKTSELRQKNADEQKKLLAESQSKLAELKFDLEGGKVKNLKAIRETRRDIARINTLLRESEINKQ